MARHVVLVGFMGAGKTTAAHSLAQTSGLPVVDVDEEVVRRDGRPIETIFSAEGEGAFRELEERTGLEVLGSREPRIVALGGGALGSAALRAALTSHQVVWIDIDTETAWARAAGRGRPLARDRDAFRELHGRREPVYAAAADVVVPQTRATGLARVLTALEGVPAGVRTLWATTPGANVAGDYPVVRRPRAAGDRGWPTRAVLAADRQRPAVPGHRLQRRTALRRAARAVSTAG